MSHLREFPITVDGIETMGPCDLRTHDDAVAPARVEVQPSFVARCFSALRSFLGVRYVVRHAF